MGCRRSRSLEETVDGYPRRVWRNEEGQDVIESFTITSMAHGTPLETGDGENAYGSAGPFLLDVGISSTYHIARFWGLTGQAVATASHERALETAPHERALETVEPARQPAPHRPHAAPLEPEPRAARTTAFRPIDVQAVIDRALKAAGLKS